MTREPEGLRLSVHTRTRYCRHPVRGARGIALGALLLATKAAWSCSCLAYPEDPQEAARQAWLQADAVVAGEVVGKRTIAADGGVETVEVTIAVARRWKGATSEVLRIHTASSSATCGYSFDTGRKYLVFADRDPAENRYATSLCSLTQPLASASALVPPLDALASAAATTTRALDK